MAKRKVCESTEISPKVAKSPTKRNGQSVQSLYQNELKRLQRLTKDVIPDDKPTAIMPLMSNIAFLKVKLDQARVDLMGESIFTEYDNGGGQTGVRENPAFRAYEALWKTYLSGLDALLKLLPEGAAEDPALSAVKPASALALVQGRRKRDA